MSIVYLYEESRTVHFPPTRASVSHSRETLHARIILIQTASNQDTQILTDLEERWPASDLILPGTFIDRDFFNKKGLLVDQRGHSIVL